MRKMRFVPKIILTLSSLCVGLFTGSGIAQGSDKKELLAWTDSFNLGECNFSSIGKNPYFVLEPGYQLILEGVEDDDSIKLVISVLEQTEKVGDIETRIVEERETVNDTLVEISRNFFAICIQTNSVFYFGEDVDIYEGGEIVSHDGAWKAGAENAKAGLMIPGIVLLGARYYQEMAPDVAMDRAEIVSDREILQTPAGRFENCLKTEETTPLEPGVKEYKCYAPGIGLIKDGDLLLTKYGTLR
ncbi:MAG: hypothetical protein V1784_04010 [bacterium]